MTKTAVGRVGSRTVAVAILGVTCTVCGVAVADADRSQSHRERLVNHAEQLVSAIEPPHRWLHRMLREARRDRDVVRSRCVDDKLNQMGATARSAERRLARLRAEAESGRLQSVRRSIVALSILRARSREIVQLARVCPARGGGRIVEGTTVSVWVDPSIPRVSLQ